MVQYSHIYPKVPSLDEKQFNEMEQHYGSKQNEIKVEKWHQIKNIKKTTHLTEKIANR